MKHGAAPTFEDVSMPTIKQRISINLPDEEYAALSALAKKNNLSMAWIGHKAIQDFLDRYHDKQLPLTFTERAEGPTWPEAEPR
jgi:predicted DNA-binding protein